MRIIYTGSRKDKLNFVCEYAKITNATFRKSTWTPISNKLKYGEKILGFSKTSTNFKVDVVFFNDDYINTLDRVDKFTDVFEIDVINNQQGVLEVDGWFIECFVIETEPLTLDGGIGRRFTIYAPNPFWTREITYNFKTSEVLSSNNKRYRYKYGYRYANGLINTNITNYHYVDCNFKLMIYGKCINPTVIIGGSIYKIYTLIEEGERLEIDSKNKTIVKVKNNGYIENLFNSRDKENDVFKKIPVGLNSVNWNGDFDFDVTIYEERSEPKWI